MNINSIVLLIRNIINDTQVDASNTEDIIIKKIRKRSSQPLSRGKVKSLLNEHSGKFWDAECVKNGNTVYTCRPIIDLHAECKKLGGN